MAPLKSASLGASIAHTSNYKLPVLKINYLNNMEEQRQGYPVRERQGREGKAGLNLRGCCVI